MTATPPAPPRPMRLPNPGVTTSDWRGQEWCACNEPFTHHGDVIGYCEVLVKHNHRGRERGTHKGPHRIEWYAR